MSAIHLIVGDHIWAARPCVVTITTTVGAVAYGHCEVCEVEHIIDRRSFEAGSGPWERVKSPLLCRFCDGTGWNEGTPAASCPNCSGSGLGNGKFE